MHPRNKMRLLAGLTIDPSLETRAMTEAREVPMDRRSLAPKDEKSTAARDSGIRRACNHLVNAVKALDRIPAIDFNGDIPVAIREIESTLSGLQELCDSTTIKEGMEDGGDPPTTSDQFSDGDVVICDDGIHVVVLADKQADMVGIIPAGMATASKEEKNRSVQMVKPDKLRKPTEEEMSVMTMSPSQRMAIDDNMAPEFSSESLNNMSKQQLEEMHSRTSMMLKAMGDDPAKVEAAEKSKRQKNIEASKRADGKGKAPGRGEMLTKAMNPKKVKDTGQRTNPLNKHIKGGAVKEGMHYYTDSYPVSHDKTSSQPINTVGQGNKQWANSLDPKSVKSEVTSQLDNRGDASMGDYTEKVKVPASLKSSLREAINTFRKDAEKQGSGHTANENKVLFTDTANAFEKLLGYLDEGTVQSVKRAQIFGSSLMGPMLHKIPDEVWDFIVNGGQKRGLKDYMIKVGK